MQAEPTHITFIQSVLSWLSQIVKQGSDDWKKNKFSTFQNISYMWHKLLVLLKSYKQFLLVEDSDKKEDFSCLYGKNYGQILNSCKKFFNKLSAIFKSYKTAGRSFNKKTTRTLSPNLCDLELFTRTVASVALLSAWNLLHVLSARQSLRIWELGRVTVYL